MRPGLVLVTGTPRVVGAKVLALRSGTATTRIGLYDPGTSKRTGVAAVRTTFGRTGITIVTETSGYQRLRARVEHLRLTLRTVFSGGQIRSGSCLVEHRTRAG